MMHEYRVGPLRFAVQGSDPIVVPLLREFAPMRAEPSPEPHLLFEFRDALSPLEDSVLVSPVRVSQTCYEASHDRLAYQVSRHGGQLRVSIRSEATRERWPTAPRWYARFKDWNYLLPAERIAKNFMYGVFDYLSQLALLPLNASYLHASSFEKEGRGVAILAWGGIGKTTAMLKLVMEDGWRFLSDDLGLIDDSGRLWRVPKRMQIYAYNVVGQPGLRRALLAGRPPLDRLSWAWRRWRRGPKGVRRRVSAEELFGSGLVGESAQASQLFFLERTTGSSFSCRPIGAEDLARRSASILHEEFKPFATLAAAIHSTSYRPVLPTAAQLEAQAVEVLSRAFSGAEAVLLQVPARAGPDDLAAELRRRIA